QDSAPMDGPMRRPAGRTRMATISTSRSMGFSMCNRLARKNRAKRIAMRSCAARGSGPAIRVEVSIVLAVLFALVLPARLAAQTRTNLAGSVTSESMTALWVARERGLFKKHGLDMQFILMPRNPLSIAALLA